MHSVLYVGLPLKNTWKPHLIYNSMTPQLVIAHISPFLVASKLPCAIQDFSISKIWYTENAPGLNFKTVPFDIVLTEILALNSSLSEGHFYFANL